MEEKKHTIDAKILVVVLSLLLVIVVVLIIINVVLSVVNNNANLAEECLQSDDINLMKDCLTEKAFSYYSAGDCVKALEVYDDIPAARFEQYTLSDLYSDAYSLSLSCGDESLENYWADKFETLSSQLEGMD